MEKMYKSKKKPKKDTTVTALRKLREEEIERNKNKQGRRLGNQ